jgi:hypothetical protein
MNLQDLIAKGLQKGQIIEHFTFFQWDGEKAVCLISDGYATKGDILPLSWDAKLTTAYDAGIDPKTLPIPEPIMDQGESNGITIFTIRSWVVLLKDYRCSLGRILYKKGERFPVMHGQSARVHFITRGKAIDGVLQASLIDYDIIGKNYFQICLPPVGVWER